jgi:tetratricopeptide (TPR) repeat protein
MKGQIAMKRVAICFVFSFLPMLVAIQPSASAADDWQKCEGTGDIDDRIRACSNVVRRPGITRVMLAEAYQYRGSAYAEKGLSDQAIEDFTKALQIKPKYAEALDSLGWAYIQKGEFQNAVKSLDLAIQSKPKYWYAHSNRGSAYAGLGDHKQAIRDFSEAIRLQPKWRHAYIGRAISYRAIGEFDKALSDNAEVIKQYPNDPWAYNDRAGTYIAANDYRRALVDLRTVLKLTNDELEKQNITNMINDIERKIEIPQVLAPFTPQPLGRRVALVIGNSKYENVSPLLNPIRDAKAVAAALRRVGFSDVILHHDLDLRTLHGALIEFADKTLGADWAVIYYSGHGIEVEGVNYVIPIDAKLIRDQHVKLEAVSLEALLDSVSAARKFKLVMLDACRDNPFLGKILRSAGTKSIGRGLASIEPVGGVLVAYAARHGHVAIDAIDGSGNSPFASALVRYLEEPHLEVSLLFRKVRDAVLLDTANAQEPFTYGSLPSEAFYFRPAR